MKFDRFDYTVWGVVAALGLAITGVILLGDQVGDRIQDMFPMPEGKAGAFSRIGIEFAQAMQIQTVEAAFRLEPTTPGRFEWEGRQMWFIPDQPLQPGARYTARLAAGPLSQG